MIPEDEHRKGCDGGFLAKHSGRRTGERFDVLPSVAEQESGQHQCDREQVLATADPGDQARYEPEARESEPREESGPGTAQPRHQQDQKEN